VIPTLEDFEPFIADPLPVSRVPPEEEISEENWGGFHDTWYLELISVDEAREVVAYERLALERLDHAAATQEEFEALASALEWGETEGPGPGLLRKLRDEGLVELMRDPDDFGSLGGLELGVSGLVHALSAVGCVTAASCRWHGGERSWSDCPVVFFAAPAAKVETLAGHVRRTGCGLREARGFLVVEAASVVHLNALARSILEERTRFSQA
jgi:hypothetical protein